MLYQLVVIHQNNLKILYLIMFDYNNKQLAVKLDYQLVKKEFAFMINKTLIIRCYSLKWDLSLDSLLQYIMHFIIT